MHLPALAIVIPASGIGKRMASELPKQYLKIHNQTIIEHTLEKFVDLPYVTEVVVALAANDQWFAHLPIAKNNKIKIVEGGKERANSVLHGLKALSENIDWVMVHDAARPCVQEEDITRLYQQCLKSNGAGILASKVRDTMKRGDLSQNITATVDRESLWHAYTPQCSNAQQLIMAIEHNIDEQGHINGQITDEASALESIGIEVQLVDSSTKNIKVTQPEDIELASFYLDRNNKHV